MWPCGHQGLGEVGVPAHRYQVSSGMARRSNSTVVIAAHL
jgi:hypothetical protein